MTTIDITTIGAQPMGDPVATTGLIQNGINNMASGDTLLIPSGLSFNIASQGILPKSNTYIQLDGTLQQNAADDSCRIIMLTDNVSMVTIQGKGILNGDKNTHIGDNSSNGAKGACVEIRNGANNIMLNGFTCQNSWADGICFAPVPDSNPRPRGVIINGVSCNYNRRNGLSVIDGDTINIMNCQFIGNGKGVNPTPPYLGIDLECDQTTYACTNVTISNCLFSDNGQTYHDGNIAVGSPAGVYQGIHITGSNIFDLRYRPIVVSGNAGKDPTPLWAQLLERVFGNFSFYKHWGYPTSLDI